MKKDLILDSNGAAPCKHCLKLKKKNVYPVIVNNQGLYYARCACCNKEDPFEFLGLTPEKAINNWNRIMLGKGEFNAGD